VQLHLQLGRLHYIANHSGGQDAAPVLDIVSRVLDAGVPTVQLRCKGCSDRDRYGLAVAVAARCREAGATFIVDDRADIAVASGADGAHVGEDDLPVAEARHILGPAAHLGATARNVAQAVAAVQAGASYVGAGPCYPTSTKEGLPAPIGPNGLASIVRAVAVPVIAIGGIDAARAREALAAGAYGVAVVSAIAAAAAPAAAARRLVAETVAGAAWARA
jgi:thiamine-phosphate pyrophosphorylase